MFGSRVIFPYRISCSCHKEGFGSLPSLRSAHGIDYKEFRVDIDPRWIPRKMLEKTRYPAGGTRRMDFECIDAWLDLPEFRVTNHVIRPHELELHLERRDTGTGHGRHFFVAQSFHVMEQERLPLIPAELIERSRHLFSERRAFRRVGFDRFG